MFVLLQTQQQFIGWKMPQAPFAGLAVFRRKRAEVPGVEKPVVLQTPLPVNTILVYRLK